MFDIHHAISLAVHKGVAKRKGFVGSGVMVAIALCLSGSKGIFSIIIAYSNAAY